VLTPGGEAVKPLDSVLTLEPPPPEIGDNDVAAAV
jgi:hypothetical protein